MPRRAWPYGRLPCGIKPIGSKEQGVVALWSGLTHFLLYAVIVLLIAVFRDYYREEKNA